MKGLDSIGYFHVCTDGRVLPWMFQDEGDFIAGVNRIGICCLKTKAKVVSYVLMDNHVHFPSIKKALFVDRNRLYLLYLQNMALSGIISQFSPNLFWDTRLEFIDMESNAPYIVQRVLENGRMSDWNLLVSYYTIPRIAEIAVNLRSLEPRALSFISVVSSTPLKKFRCYTLRQSSQRHWIY